MEILFHWIGGATFVMTIGNLNIACDPVLCEKGKIQDYFWFKSKRLEEPMYDEKTFSNIDLWLITHNHEDHLDSIGLSKIDSDCKVVSNKNSSKILQESGKNDLTVLDWKQTTECSIKGYEIEIEAIPAIHGVNPLSALFAGKVNGYYLTISKGKETVSVYITGDTVYKNKVVNSLSGKEIDLLIPNMGAAKQGSWIMTLTLNSKMLKKMISKLNPEIVIPVHYGTFEHYKEPVGNIEKINDERIKIVEVGSKTELKIKNAGRDE
jgi:L-ascorbate metabolism protein UlaG (beta-lactamase superfamily)